MITVAAPNPAIDKLLRVSRLQPGTIHRPNDQVAVPGGKGLNVARVAHVLGAAVHVVGIAAGTAGEWIAHALDELEIAADWMWAPGESRTCTSIADVTTYELTEFYETGPFVDAEVWAGFIGLVTAVTSSSQWLAVSGSLPPGVTEPQFLTLLAAHSGHTAVDTSDDALRTAASWASTGLVKLNARETLELLRRDNTLQAADSLPTLAQELSRYCGQGTTVVVTGGTRGAVMIDHEGRPMWARLPVVGRYPVGSGDAFLAGLLTARQQGESWAGALRLATAAAAANAEVPGAGALTLERVRSLCSLVEVGEARRPE